MKIILVSYNGLHGGGVERVNQYLYKIFSRNYVVIVQQRVTVNKYLLRSNLFQSFFTSFKLYLSNKSFVISNGSYAPFYPSDILIQHGTSLGIYKRLKKRLTIKAFVKFILEKIALYNAKTVWAVSTNCKEELHQLYGVPNTKIQVVNNFVDEDFFYYIFTPKIIQPVKLIRIIFVGRLEFRKGLDRLYLLADYIETQKERFSLTLISPEISDKDLFSNFSNTKVLCGLSVSEINKYYNFSDILFFPTRYEGFPMVTLEALATGLPVIGSSFAIMDELVEYPFCKILNDVDLENPKFICGEMEKIVRFSKKEKISKIITEKFGKQSYCEKIQALLPNFKLKSQQTDL